MLTECRPPKGAAAQMLLPDVPQAVDMGGDGSMDGIPRFAL
jgi:hypothetical protein